MNWSDPHAAFVAAAYAITALIFLALAGFAIARLIGAARKDRE